MKKIVFLGLVLLVGCADAEIIKNGAVGRPHKITLYSGGQAVKTWHSIGNVETYEDRCYFTDSKTGQSIRVVGDTVIEVE